VSDAPDGLREIRSSKPVPPGLIWIVAGAVIVPSPSAGVDDD
jgi:hypothetical protein